MSHSEPVPQRIGDAERDQATDVLREHMVAGRLSQDEFADRINVALNARTADELTPLFQDLPGPKPGPLAVSAPFPQPPRAEAQGLATPGPDRSAAVQPEPETGWNRAMMLVSAVAWPATIVLLFATNWHFWWLIFIPVMLSSITGKYRHDRHRDRDRWRGRNRGIER